MNCSITISVILSISYYYFKIILIYTRIQVYLYFFHPYMNGMGISFWPLSKIKFPKCVVDIYIYSVPKIMMFHFTLWALLNTHNSLGELSTYVQYEILVTLYLFYFSFDLLQINYIYNKNSL